MTLPIYTPTNILSTSPPTFVISCLFGNTHPYRCELISHHGFDLHFSDDQRCWAPFHVPVSHFISSFDQGLVRSFAHFWIVCFPAIELFEFPTYFRFYPLIRCTVCKYSLPICPSCLSSCWGFCCCAKSF